MRPPHLIFIALLGLGVAGCSNPKDAVIPSDMNRWEAELKPNTDRLTPEERESVGKFLLRKKMGEAFGKGTDSGPITIGRALELQKEFEAEQVKEEAKLKAEEEKAKAEEAAKAEKRKQADEARAALAKQVNEAFSVTLKDVDFRGLDIEASRFSEEFLFSFAFNNRGSKKITGFKGQVVFEDSFGEEVQRINLKEETAIAPGKSVPWTGTSNYNPFEARDQKFKALIGKTLKIRFEPETLLFADGTKLTVPAESTR